MITSASDQAFYVVPAPQVRIRLIIIVLVPTTYLLDVPEASIGSLPGGARSTEAWL
jgi:hypothetical protein